MTSEMTSEAVKSFTDEYILPTYGRYQLCLASGKGCRAQDFEGNRYLDFTSGIGVNCLGWADDEWQAAVAQQAATLQHSCNLYYTQPAAQLAEALCHRTGMAKVFFANSGAEANEGAIKAARKYSLERYGEGRHTVVSLVNSFHGRTMGSLSATGQEALHRHFHPFLPGFAHLPAGDVPALEKALDGTVCAVLLEPIQGEGGVVPLAKEYLAAVRALCTERDVLLIADEIQTGVGRTGAFLASEKAGIKPDIVTLAKGLGGGLPIGAVLLAKGCATALAEGDHGSTFGANPVACAGALVVVRRLDDAFLATVARKGALLRQRLKALPGILQVDGDGLMLGAALAEGFSAGAVVPAAIKNGLMVLTAKDRLRFLPPLIITEEEIDEGIGILKKTLEELL